MHSEKIEDKSEKAFQNEKGEKSSVVPFEDNRPEAQQHRTMQSNINNSPQVLAGKTLQAKVNQSQRVKQLQGPATATPPTNLGGFIGTDGAIVELVLVDGHITIQGENAPGDLRELIEAINNSGSPTAVNEIMEITQNQTRVHVVIEDDEVENSLYGLHQAHDEDGNPLEWDGEANDFNGTPAYAGPGVYSEATITIFRGNLRAGDGNASSHQSAGLRLSLDQLVAGTFQHEVHHDTDREFIEDLHHRRDGEENENIDPHQNVHPQDDVVYREMGDAQRNQEQPSRRERRRQRRTERQERRRRRRQERAERRAD